MFHNVQNDNVVLDNIIPYLELNVVYYRLFDSVVFHNKMEVIGCQSGTIVSWFYVLSTW